MTIKTSTIWRFISYWTWGIFPASHVSKGGAWWALGRKAGGFARWPCFIHQLSAWKWRIPKGNVKVRRGRSRTYVEGGPVNTGPDGRRPGYFGRHAKILVALQKNVVFFFNSNQMTSFFCSWKTGSVILHALGRWSKLTPAEFQFFLVETGRFSMTPQLGGWSLTFGVIGEVGNVMPTVKPFERQLNLIWWSICKNLDSNFVWKEEWSKNMAVVPRVV